jgi:hypothetical protein
MHVGIVAMRQRDPKREPCILTVVKAQVDSEDEGSAVWKCWIVDQPNPVRFRVSKGVSLVYSTSAVLAHCMHGSLRQWELSQRVAGPEHAVAGGIAACFVLNVATLSEEQDAAAEVLMLADLTAAVQELMEATDSPNEALAKVQAVIGKH